jgi:hypothetical protein
MDLKEEYSSRQQQFTFEKRKLNRKLRGVALLRLFAFLGALLVPFFLYGTLPTLGFSAAVALFALFLFWVKRYQQVEAQRNKAQRFIEINQNELKALDHDFAHFDAGAQFIDPNHHYTYDLDIFGKGSLFQFLNRTVLLSGRLKLAKLLSEPILDVEEIKKNQQFIAELAQKLHWRQTFAATGLSDAQTTDQTVFERARELRVELKFEQKLPILIPIFIVFSLAGLVVWIFTGNSALFFLASLLQAGLWVFQLKIIKKTYSFFGKQAEVLACFASMFEQIERENWEGEQARNLVSQLHESGLPSKSISKLRSIISAFDNRNNFLIGVLLNLMFCWDVWCTWRLNRWHAQNRDNYALWDQTLARFDALCSLANWAYNNPQNTWPEPVVGDFAIESNELAHPLIHPKKRKGNNFEMAGRPAVVIVTGANMSGKSTFLRTVGVNMVLAMAGAPVCAARMQFTPVALFSNMRTTDSLFDDESYFFAELKRLQSILVEIEKGTSVLVVLDEILKGTNSVDKLYGSQQLVRRLVARHATVVIATHDLKLTELETEFLGVVQNRCFEIEIKNDEMHFDYQLRKGVTHVMNATFLMKKMGIIEG